MSKDKSGFVIKSETIVIKAPSSAVWEFVKDPNGCEEYSNGAIKAHVEGPVAVNSKITLKVKGLPTSHEVISEVNIDHSIGWRRKLPIGGSTNRVQVLVPIEGEDGEKTKSTITLTAPGPIGLITYLFFKRRIVSAFDAYNNGLKGAAEAIEPLIAQPKNP